MNTSACLLLCAFALLVFVTTGCANVAPWERETLGRPDMAWDPDPLEST